MSAPHHGLEDVSCHAAAYRMCGDKQRACEGMTKMDVRTANEEHVKGSSVTPMAGRQPVSCPCRLDVNRGRRRCHTTGWRKCQIVSYLHLLVAKDTTKNFWKTTMPHHRLEDMLRHASACWM